MFPDPERGRECFYCMKRILPIALGLLCGCVSPTKSITALVKGLAGDPATVYVRVPTPYGTILFIRTNPGTNTIAQTIDPEGKVSVGIP